MPRRHGNADLWAVLPVGPSTAARSAAKSVYHAPVRMTLNAGVPAERRTALNSGSFPPPAFGGLCRPPPGELAGGRRSLACASLCMVACGRGVHHPGTALSCRRGEQADPIMRVSPGGGSSLTRLVSRAPPRSRRSPGFHHRLLIHQKETGNETSELRVLSCRPPAAGCAGLKTGAPLPPGPPRPSALRGFATKRHRAEKQRQRTPFAARVTGGKV